MKLKRFQEFVNEAKVNESSTTATVEESAFLVDGHAYLIGEIELDVDLEYDSPEPEVGIYGGYGADGWSIYSISGVYKVTEPDVVDRIEQIKKDAGDLNSMGFSEVNVNDQITDLIFNADSEEVTGPELAALEKRIIELDRAGQLIDLTGDFESRCNKAVESAVEDYEPDEPDYDDWRDDY